jgi:hypothetical protein
MHHIILLSFFITGLCFQSHYKESNIDQFISKDKLSEIFTYIFQQGTNTPHINSLYKLQKNDLFFNLPVEFSTISFLVASRLELPSYQAEIESIFSLYINSQTKRYNKEDFLNYLKNQHKINFLNNPNPNFNMLLKD